MVEMGQLLQFQEFLHLTLAVAVVEHFQQVLHPQIKELVVQAAQAGVVMVFQKKDLLPQLEEQQILAVAVVVEILLAALAS